MIDPKDITVETNESGMKITTIKTHNGSEHYDGVSTGPKNVYVNHGAVKAAHAVHKQIKLTKAVLVFGIAGVLALIGFIGICLWVFL